METGVSWEIKGSKLSAKAHVAYVLKRHSLCSVFNHGTRFQKHLSFVETRFGSRNI